jgi:hypothetical protein
VLFIIQPALEVLVAPRRLPLVGPERQIPGTDYFHL